MKIHELIQMRRLPLEIKELKTKQRIKELKLIKVEFE